MTRDELADRFSLWSPRLLRFLTLAEHTASTRVIAELPIGHQWPHRPGVTLLGDAAHIMSPFSGEGANLAMRDAADLAQAIVHADQKGLDLNGAVAAFENVMCGRARESAAGAAEGVRQAFAEDAIIAVAEGMQRHFE